MASYIRCFVKNRVLGLGSCFSRYSERCYKQQSRSDNVVRRWGCLDVARVHSRQFTTGRSFQMSYATSISAIRNRNLSTISNTSLSIKPKQPKLNILVRNVFFGTSCHISRCYSSASGGDSASNLGDDDPEDGESVVVPNVAPVRTLISPNVPDEWPKVPVIAINRNPLFPSFIKFMSVSTQTFKTAVHMYDT